VQIVGYINTNANEIFTELEMAHCVSEYWGALYRNRTWDGHCIKTLQMLKLHNHRQYFQNNSLNTIRIEWDYNTLCSLHTQIHTQNNSQYLSTWPSLCMTENNRQKQITGYAEKLSTVIRKTWQCDNINVTWKYTSSLCS
jgi:hypothetical protein